MFRIVFGTRHYENRVMNITGQKKAFLMLHNINGINVAWCRTLKGTSAWIMLMYVNISMIYVCKYEGNVNHPMELWYKLEVD